MKNFLFSIITISLTYIVNGQYAPGAGAEGSTAIHMDNSVFKAWATSCIVTRGPQNIVNSSSVLASSGNEDAAIGKAGASTISLGDGGIAVLTFASPIVNGPGYDFAVFENGFNIVANNDFLELAFVEVSSDGENYYRFSSKSSTATSSQIGSFGGIDPTKIHNLAGKYLAGYGTPFDLEELKNTPGLNVNSITHIKIIDVIGTINEEYATKDSDGNMINDPWPTEFASSGFDLDAVGVINSSVTSIAKSDFDKLFSVYPNPVNRGENFQISIEGVSGEELKYSLYDTKGMVVHSGEYKETIGILSTEELQQGIYILKIGEGENGICRKLIIN